MTDEEKEKANQAFYESVCKENGYFGLKMFDNGEAACIMPLMFTHAIIYGLERYGYENRWCYHTAASALKALNEWNGVGEPQGWHRHPDTGRRVNEDGEMYVGR